jgi:hypothetical protein
MDNGVVGAFRVAPRDDGEARQSPEEMSVACHVPT